MSNLIRWFKATDMPTTLRSHKGDELANPNWKRLQRHIARHEKAGGLSCIKFRPIEPPVSVGRYWCIEMADIELFEPLT